MKTEKLSVRQLLSGIPSYHLDTLAEDHHVDLTSKKLLGKDIFHLLLYGLFDSTKLSWRVLEEHYSSPIFQKGFTPNSKGIDHSSLEERLSKIPLGYFEDIFDYSFSYFARYYSPLDYKRFNIVRFDSTIVTLSSKLLKIGLTGLGQPNKEGHTKQLIKYSVGFNGTFVVKAKAHFSNTYHSENVALAELIGQTDFQPNDVAVFDRGLSGKKRLSDISLDNIRFVTRINANTKIEKCETLPFSTIKGEEDQTVIILEDSLVYCFTEKGKKVESPFRRIVCKQKQTGETLYFLTNMMDVSAIEVAQIYRLRWDIELFFKFIKQYFSFSHLISRKEHIIQIMLYMTMIAASMIYIYRKINEIESFKIAKMRFVNHLQIDLLTIIWKSGYASELFSKENFAT